MLVHAIRNTTWDFNDLATDTARRQLLYPTGGTSSFFIGDARPVAAL